MKAQFVSVTSNGESLYEDLDNQAECERAQGFGRFNAGPSCNADEVGEVKPVVCSPGEHVLEETSLIRCRRLEDQRRVAALHGRRVHQSDRSLMTMLFGWLIVVPPLIAMYNTALHVRGAENQLEVQGQLDPASTVVLMLVVAIGNTIYIQEHQNRIWDRASFPNELQPSPSGELPMPPSR